MKKIQIGLLKLTRVLEIIIMLTVVIAIAISMKTLIMGLLNLNQNVLENDAFLGFLAIDFNLLIGIEFLKMIYNYSVDTVIEVLLFAIARQLIVEHTTILENFIGIAAIALLFAIRKYFFIPGIDKDSKAE